MKTTIEPRPAECLPKLPALYLNKTSGSVNLIRLAPMPMPGTFPSIAPTPPYVAILLFEDGQQGVRVGASAPVHNLDNFEPFIGRLILENDK